jgi:hypothetical protein
MKAYISRSSDGTVSKGWLLREGLSIHSTMCRLRRTELDAPSIEEASTEAVLSGASQTTCEG